MASAVAHRTWCESTPEAVEADLAALWREIARHGVVARAVMSNLIVIRLRESSSDSIGENAASRSSTGAGRASESDLLEAVVARHPSRAIVIERLPGDPALRAPVGASVGVSIFGPPNARYGVESVVVRSACADACLPSIIRRLVRGDIPTSIWWTEDVSRALASLRTLVTMGRQLVYDSRRWQDVGAGLYAVAALAAEGTVDLADLNWRRLAPLRHALEHAATSGDPTVVTAERVRIRHQSNERALAWLLAGWMAAKLGWTGSAWPDIAEDKQNAEILVLTIGDRTPALTACLNEHRVHLEMTGQPPFVVAVRQETAADAIAAELRTLACETDLHEALAAAARRVSRGA
jgi:glucose-6-phosphate dehydrogenase assembly protein OpcA